jgi:hypothetical protein
MLRRIERSRGTETLVGWPVPTTMVRVRCRTSSQSSKRRWATDHWIRSCWRLAVGAGGARDEAQEVGFILVADKARAIREPDCLQMAQQHPGGFAPRMLRMTDDVACSDQHAVIAALQYLLRHRQYRRQFGELPPSAVSSVGSSKLSVCSIRPRSCRQCGLPTWRG